MAKELDKEEEKSSDNKDELADALALNIESEVPAERAKALQALRRERSHETAEDDEWLELYGIDEDYAQMVREMLGEGQNEAEKGRYSEDFDDDE
jgi:hypothetical protein